MQRDYLEQEFGYEPLEPSLDAKPCRDWGMIAMLVAAGIGIICVLAWLGGCAMTMSAQTPKHELAPIVFPETAAPHIIGVSLGVQLPQQTDAQPPAPQPVVIAPTTPQAQYRYHDGAALNDLDATPGAINGLTRQQLCDPSFHTGTIRSVTEATKHKVCALYGIARADCTGQKYEIDHLISLELGGSNDITNLWPQPYAPKPGAKEKDVVENHLHAEVCAGHMTLPEAQLAISTDWYQVFLDINGAIAKTGAGR